MNATTIIQAVKNYLPLAKTFPVLGGGEKVLFRYHDCQYVTDGYCVTECLDDPDFPEVDIDLDFEEALAFIATVGC
jgi:hypothetical protein